MNQTTDWHRLFGITLMDYFAGSKYRVELEKDLSLQKQFLDVVIIEQAQGGIPTSLPDGFANLKKHNLLTYKSHHESLGEWSLDELLGHYVNYRKQTSEGKKLLPAREFQLYAVCTLFPEKLAKRFTLRRLKAGVYQVLWGSQRVRLIVTSRIPRTPNNILWHLFSNVLEQVTYAKVYHHWRNPKTSSVINQLFERYFNEGVFMPYTMEDYERDTQQWVLAKLKKAVLQKNISLSDVLEDFSPEEVMNALSPKAVKKLSPKLLEVLPPETLLKAIPTETIEAYLAKQKKPRRRKLSG